MRMRWVGILLVAAGAFSCRVASAVDFGGYFDSLWRYSSNKDEMRQSETQYATLASVNQESFAFPYNGGSSLLLELRISPRYGRDVILRISKGQFRCGFDGCEVSVKFDDGKVLAYGASGAADGSADILFINNYASFVSHLRKAKELIIEAAFYSEGTRQFSFNIPPLKWDDAPKTTKKKTTTTKKPASPPASPDRNGYSPEEKAWLDQILSR